MLARDVMTTNVISVAPETGVREIAERLIENRISGVPVVDQDGRLAGIVSESDLMRRAESETERRPSWWLSLLLTHEAKTADYVKTHGRCAAHVMTRNVISVDEDTPLEEVADILQKHRIKRVPVLRDGKLVGIVARSDLLHGLIARRSAPASSPEDRQIKAAFLRELDDADVDASLLNVVVAGGVIHVWGVVLSPQERDAARIAARSLAGVKDVVFNVDAVPPSYRRAMFVE